MRSFSAPVKHSLTVALPGVGIRTRAAVARSYALPHSHRRARADLIARLQAVLLAPDLVARLDPFLTQHDRALYEQLGAGNP